MINAPWYDTVVIPGLLRHARHTYGSAMRRDLDAAGYDDIPANGLYILGALALAGIGAPITEFMRGLKVSRQAAGQLIDTLVMRGYLERTPDEVDRRQLIVTLTPRGADAAAIQAKVRGTIDAELTARIGPEAVAAGRKMLGTLIEMAREERTATR